jgi:hypothetical protein
MKAGFAAAARWPDIGPWQRNARSAARDSTAYGKSDRTLRLGAG